MEVKELSSRMSSLKRTLTEKENLRKLGEKIYKLGEPPPLDPFSPGLQGLARSGDPQALLKQLSVKLEQVQRADPDWQGFYAARRSVERFEGTPGDSVLLKAQWEVFAPDRSLLMKRELLIGEQISGGSYDALVAAMSSALGG